MSLKAFHVIFITAASALAFGCGVWGLKSHFATEGRLFDMVFGIGSLLVGAALLMRMQAVVEDAPPELREQLEETKRLANKAMGELIDLARQLRPAALDDHGLVAALQTHVKEYDRRGDASVHFWVDPGVEDLKLGDDVQVVVYRVAQEALVNASRHSGASRIEVNLERQNGAVNLSVADNGSGFAFADEGKGLGLSGMRERALLVGGRLEIDSRPGTGTTVKLEVPAR